MKLLSLLLVILLSARAATAQAAKSAPPPKKEECSIAGMVVKMASSEALRKAQVRLQSLEDPTHVISTVTDAGGRFQLQGLAPGRYNLTVSRVGFVMQTYGQRKADAPGAALTLRSGQNMKDLLFRLIPSAVIAGRILDEDGEPLPGATVSALREVYSEGKRSLSTSTTVETNDRGEYRLFGLPPGRYFISAVNAAWDSLARSEEVEDRDVHQQGYAKMYYPGTPDATQAASIAIQAGEEIPSIEMLLRQVPVYRIRGHVYNQITHKPGTATNILLTSRGSRLEWESRPQVLVQKQDASFEIPDVLPGSYVVTALWFDEGRTYASKTPVDVGHADVEGITVTIAPGVSISGRIIWEGQPSLDHDELTVGASPADFSFAFWDDARVTEGNSFTLKNIGEGTYRAEVAGQSKDCYVRDVQYGGASALEEGFTVGRGTPAMLEVTISSHGARVQGTVVDADGLPAVGVWVALVPDRARRTQYRLYKTQTTDQYGHFDLRGIAPGEYKLFSWEEAESDAWQDPEFLKAFEDKGEKISVPEGYTKSVTLVAIQTVSSEPQKR